MVSSYYQLIKNKPGVTRGGTMMTETTSEVNDNAVQVAEKGTGLLFWGWIVVTILNLGMVAASLAIFAP